MDDKPNSNKSSDSCNQATADVLKRFEETGDDKEIMVILTKRMAEALEEHEKSIEENRKVFEESGKVNKKLDQEVKRLKNIKGYEAANARANKEEKRADDSTEEATKLKKEIIKLNEKIAELELHSK